MTGTVLALLVDGAGATLLPLPVELRAFKGAIGGGWLEAIGVPDPVGDLPAWHAYLDEEGKLKRLPANVPATRLARAAGWPGNDLLHGPVLFLGTAPPSGEDGSAGEADVPAPLVTLARAYVMQADGYTCPRCGAVSWDPLDRRYSYCGRCHQFADPGVSV